MFNLGIITASDKGARGERIDLSGPLIKETMEAEGYEVAEIRIIADERKELSQTMIEFCDDLKYDLVLTTGGTGFSPRDWTPEATLDVIERQAPGLAEAMRLHSLKITPKAMLSRAVAGIRGRSLIINLPGSPKAVRENLECLIPALKHGLEILIGKASECGGQ